MSTWSIARRAAIWFGGLLLTLLLGLVLSAYLMVSVYVSAELDEEVQDLGQAAASQLVGASDSQAESILELLIKEGNDLGMGFILEREGGELRAGRSELVLERPEHLAESAWRNGAIPIPDGSTLLIGIDGTSRGDKLDRIAKTLGWVSLCFAGIAGIAGWLFGRRMSAMLSQVAQAVDPTGAPTPRGAPQEISALVDAINSGFAQANEAQSRSKLLIVGAAHALRSPIQALLTQAQSTLRKERDGERYREVLESQEHELIEFGRSVDNLVAFCADTGEDHVSEAFDLMAELELRLQPDMDRARRSGTELSFDGPTSLLVEAERESLILAARNLVSNALSVSGSGHQVHVRVQREGKRVLILVDDQGPGIPEDEREIVFEPMRRASSTPHEAHGRARYGLGLALVRRAMADHGGRAWIESSPAGGARACLEFEAIREGLARNA